jgi:Protein of unknown function (DUF3800)
METVSIRHKHEGRSDQHPCVWVRSLVSGLPHEARKRRLLLVLQVFIDDSGRGQEHKTALVLAGFIAPVRIWESFSDEWAKALSAPPKIDCFKAYEAYGFRKQFKGWKEDARDKKLLKLVAVIRKHYWSAVKLTVNGTEFDQILQDPSDPSLKNAYALAVAAITTRVLSIAFRSRTRRKLDFIFDEGMLHAKVFEQAFEEMMRSAIPKAALDLFARKPHMENDLTFLPLQAADFLARHMREEYEIAAGRIERVWLVREALRTIPVIDAPLHHHALQYLKQALAQRKKGTDKL